MLLEEKTAIVTGGARGIGKAICEAFANEGADLLLGDLDINEAKKTSEFITKQTNRKCIPIKVDISKEEDVNKMVLEAIKEFGKIDILVNNAAIFLQKPILEMSEGEWNKIIDVNLKGTFLCSRAVAKEMIKRRRGKIISISSLTAKKPSLYESAYAASKAGIIGFNRVLALELGLYGINCNVICPGATDTEMIRKTFLTSPKVEKEWIEKTALKRLGKPDDQAKVALFLASELSGHITGEAIIVSAGEVMGQ